MAQLLHIKLTASLLSYILIGVLLVAIGLTAATVYFAQSVISEKAREVDHSQIDAEFAQKDVELLQQLQDDLEANQAEIIKAENIVAESQSYTYQNQVVNDVTRYANRSNVTIEGFDFSDDTSDPSSQKSSSATAKKLLVTIRISDGTSYDNFLRFLRSVEQNITKMQLTGIALQPQTDDLNLITQTSMELEVYVQ